MEGITRKEENEMKNVQSINVSINFSIFSRSEEEVLKLVAILENAIENQSNVEQFTTTITKQK
jgi:hypothetical protein